MNARLKAYLGAEIAALRDKGMFRMPRVLETAAGPSVRMDGREIIQLSSNNYLGLTVHPKVVEAARRAVMEFGAGPGAVRTIAGTMSLHLELERRLARFKGTEAALVFQSGYTANVGVVSTLMQEGDLIVSDELNHASIIDGCRLSRADRAIYRHLDYGHLRDLLKAARQKKTAKILVVADGVFSMDGDVSDLPAIASLCGEFDAIPMVDDAHATGVLGRNGRGTVDHFGLHRIGQRRDVFVFNLVLAGTLEEELLRILEEKIHLFELIVGEVDSILGHLERREEFADILLALWAGSRDEAERRARFEALGMDLASARAAYEADRSLEDSLFADDLEA